MTFMSQMSCNVSVLIRSSSNFSVSSRFSISFLLIIIDSLLDLSLLSVSLRVSLIKFPSSNCAKVITLLVCSLDDVVYGVYVNFGRIVIASAYGHDVYDNALEKLLSNTTSYDEIIFLVLGTYTRYPFWCCGIPTKMPQNHFCAWWRMFNVFVSTCAVAFRTTHGQNKTRKCDTEGFVPVASLYGVVGSPSSFIRSFIGSTGKIWSVVYILH